MQDFYRDLKKCCNGAAVALRDKNIKWNNGIPEKKKLYSGEREFLAEVYRLLIEIDRDYTNHLFVDYLPAIESEGSKRVLPDVVYLSDDPNDKGIVEAKVIVTKRKKGDPNPYKSDRESIDLDYDKLKRNYKRFKRKFLVVAYLGDVKYKDDSVFSIRKFKNKISELYQDTGEIKVISC